MSWIMVGIGTLGAAAGGAGGYFGTSKKNRGKSGTKNAILGALGGATLGLGGAGLLGVGAGGAAAPIAAGGVGTAATSPALALGASQMGTYGSALGGAGMGAGTASVTANSALTTGVKQGMLSKILGSQAGQKVIGDVASKMLLGSEQQPQQASQMATPNIQAQYDVAPMTGGANPLAYAGAQGMLEEEKLRRRMMGYGY